MKGPFLKYLFVNIYRFPKFIFDKLLHREKFAHPEKTIQIVKESPRI